MLPASMKGPGMNFGAPDVCLTPVGPVIVPIPYPNFGAHATAVVFSSVVTVNMMPALNLASVLATTTGDEPGVAHWTIMGPGAFTVGNPVVFVEGLPGIMVTAQTTGNNANCPTGTVVAPGSTTVQYTLAPEDARAGGHGPSSGAAGAGDAGERLLPGERLSPGERLLSGERLSPGERLLPEERLSGEPLAGAPRVLEGGVGLVRVRVFSLALPGALHLALERMAAGGMQAVVIDLRGCPGGELTALIEAASDFLPAGARVLSTRDAEGDETPVSARGGPCGTLPVFLAVDGTTASAAELFAAILAAHGRAVVVGERTFGKGVAQTADGGTTAEVLLPDGTSLNGTGLSPRVGCAAKDAVETAIVLARQDEDGRST